MSMSTTRSFPSEKLELEVGKPDLGARRRPVEKTLWLKDRLICKQEWRVICELAVTIMLGFIVWGLVSLPIVFYYLNQNQGQNAANSLMSENMSNVAINNTNFGNGTHICLNKYTGTHCHSALQELTACDSSPSERTDIYTSNFVEDQNVIEEEIETLLFTLDTVIKPSDECRNKVIPFFCLYKFGLCSENSTDYRPTAAECSNIRDSVCESEWKKTTDLLEIRGLPPLPDCSRFSDDGLKCEVLSLNDTPCTVDCHYHFYCENNFCKPRCDRFRVYSDEYILLSDAIMISSGCIGLVCGTVVAMIFVIKHRTMMIFPTFFIFYSTVSFIIVEIIILISFMDRPALFCNSIDLLESLEHPTPFCKLSGIVESYVIMQVTSCWLFHIVALFWKFQFPFHSRHYNNMKRTKYIHAICVLLALVFPTLPSITASVEGGFIMPSFPPIVCVAREADVHFYSFILPTILLYAVGTTVLLAILWRIRRHMDHRKSKSASVNTSFPFSPAERKIFIVFLYYLASAALQLTAVSIHYNYTDHNDDAYASYFNCQRSGHDRSCSLDILHHPVLILLSNICLLLYPAANLVYVVRTSDVKMLCKICTAVKRVGILSHNTRGIESNT